MSFPELSEADVRSMIRLVGDIGASRGGAQEKRRVLMDGLIRLVDAHRWFWTLSSRHRIQPGKQPLYTAVAHGGFEDGQFPKLLRALDHPASWGIFTSMSREIKERGQHLTWTRGQMDLEGHFGRQEVKQLWHEAGIGDLMISACPLPNGDLSAVGIYRQVGEDAFDMRSARMAHIVLAEVPWLHETDWPEEKKALLPTLSPRRRTVLHLMLEGQSRKEMAATMGISVHTLDGYVKDIFRHFRAHSQAELIARFRSGDAGIPPDPGTGS
jgi:DNA-binding CsgD family transcriptional regulator